MTYRKIPSEQPPTDNVSLKEWLTRLVNQINGVFNNTPNFTPTGIMPNKLENGMVRYFNQTILPDITSAGPWMYVESSWKKITTENTPFIPITNALPTNVQNGTARYFSQAILPNITSPGPWMYVEGSWEKMTT